MTQPIRHTLWQSFMRFSSTTLISRVFGFVRDLSCAHILGSSPWFAAFLVAFQLPNFFRRLFAEGAFSQAFIPILSDSHAKSSQSVTVLMSTVSAMMAFVSSVVVLLLMGIAPWVLRIYAPGFLVDSLRFQAALHYMYWTMPYLICIAISSVGYAWLHCHKRFVLAAASPIWMNMAWLLALLWSSFYPTRATDALAYAVLIAGIVQCLIVVIYCLFLDASLLNWRAIQWRHPAMKRLGKKMSQTLLGNSVSQCGVMLDTMFASLLPMGSIAWLYYTSRLIYLPLGLIGVAVSTILLPRLSAVVKKPQQFQHVLRWGVRLLLGLGLPAAMGLTVLSYPIVVTLFQYQAFTAHDAWMTHLSVSGLALGLPFFMLAKACVTACYAQKNTKKPMQVAMICLVLNGMLSFILMHFFAHTGLVVATSLVSLLQVLYLSAFLKRHYLTQSIWQDSGWLVFSLATLVMGGVLYMLSPQASQWDAWTASARIMHLMLYISFAITLYTLLVWPQLKRWRDIKSWSILSESV